MLTAFFYVKGDPTGAIYEARFPTREAARIWLKGIKFSIEMVDLLESDDFRTQSRLDPTRPAKHLYVDGHVGTWSSIDCVNVDGVNYWLLEHEQYGDDAPCLYVDQNCKVIVGDVWNGIDDLLYFLEIKEDAEEREQQFYADPVRLFQKYEKEV